MLKRLRPANRIELSVGIGFSIVGFLMGSTLIRNTFKSEIHLDSPQEVTQPDSKPYLDQSILDSENSNSTVKSKTTDVKPLQNKKQPAISPSPVNEFTSLSQEEKNCIIWKNAYPEAAYKLKKGDSCY